MIVYVARHAWAGDYGDPAWPDDDLRPLTPEGVERYTEVIKTLAQRQFEPYRIAASPLLRCQQTAAIISRHSPHFPDVDTLDALAPGVNLEEILEWTCAQQGSDVCWCGHNPDMPYVVAALIGGSPHNIRFAKGAIAAIRFHGLPSLGTGELLWHVTAKVLGC